MKKQSSNLKKGSENNFEQMSRIVVIQAFMSVNAIWFQKNNLSPASKALMEKISTSGRGEFVQTITIPNIFREGEMAKILLSELQEFSAKNNKPIN